MTEMHPSEAMSALRQRTVLLPATGVGNLGQLAVDLLIATLQLPILATLQDDTLLPCVGNQAYSSDRDQLHCELELYGREQDDFAVVQQRAPAATGRQEQFASNLARFLQEAQVAEVIVIGSLDMALRQDEHLEGPQIYFVVNDAERAQHMQQLRWSRLEVDDLHADIGWAHALPPWPLWRQCQGLHTMTTLLLAFTSESASIPDAMLLARHVLLFLREGLGFVLPAAASMVEPKWNVPPSWAPLLGLSQAAVAY